MSAGTFDPSPNELNLQQQYLNLEYRLHLQMEGPSCKVVNWHPCPLNISYNHQRLPWLL